MYHIKYQILHVIAYLPHQLFRSTSPKLRISIVHPPFLYENEHIA